MKKPTPLILVLIAISNSFCTPNHPPMNQNPLSKNFVFQAGKADLVVRAEIIEAYPCPTYDWGTNEFNVLCKPLQIYKGTLPDTASIFGFNLSVKIYPDKTKEDTVKQADKSPSVKIGQQYILFISTKNPEQVNYLKENKLYPFYSLSDKAEESVVLFSEQMEKQILDSIKK
jgi:hypothetical protein